MLHLDALFVVLYFIKVENFVLIIENPQKLAQTSPTGGGRSVGIVRVRTKATEFFF